MTISQQIELEMQKSKPVTRASAIRLSRSLQKKITDLVIKRTQDGYDMLSRKFGGYNKSYKKKRAFKYATRRYGRTKYASNSTSDKLQLTGNLLSSIYTRTKQIKQTKSNLILQFIIDVSGTLNKKKAKGLQSTTGVARNKSRYSKKNWLFLGLATSGSYKAKESKMLNTYISKFLKQLRNTRVKI